MAYEIKEAKLMNEILKELISHIELPTDQLADQDPEITEIFVEEVQEILDFLDQAIPTWLDNPSDTEILKDIRRSYHTLKGSGRMAGAVQSGELAWSIEDMLNRVMVGAVPVTRDVQELVYSVATLYPILVEDFKNLSPHQIEFRPWIAAARQLKEGEELNPALRFTVNYYKDKVLAEDVSTEENTIAEEIAAPITEVPHEDTVESTEPVTTENHSDENILYFDPQTLEIFLEESNEHLYTIHNFLHNEGETSIEQFNQLIRAIHTIRGSSGMVGLEEVFTASSQVENVFKGLTQEADEEYEAEAELLSKYYGYVKSYTEVLDSGRIEKDKLFALTSQFNVAWDEYRQVVQVDDAEETTVSSQGIVATLLELDINDVLDAEFSFADEIAQQQHSYLELLITQADILRENTTLRQTEALHQIAGLLKNTYQAMLALPSFDAHDDLINRVQVLHQYIIDAFDGLASGQNIAVTNLAIEDFDAALADIQYAIDHPKAPVDEQQEVSLIPQDDLNFDHIQSADTPVTGHTNYQTNTEFDADLLDIFLEESDELVVGMDNDFSVWEKDTKNTQVLKNLFRYLHTLKGGANMVQATNLGVIAHELETIYERVVTGQLVPTQQALQTIRYAQDDIAMRLQRLKDEAIDEPDPHLIAQLQAIYSDVAHHQVEIAPVSDHADEPESEIIDAPISEPTEPESVESIHIEIEDAQPANTEFDADLLDIFLEESEELVIGMDEDFNAWERNPKNTEVLKNLFRYLHTLKGGANMIQATHLGMIAHELETIYERVLKGTIKPTSNAMQTIRFAQDEIATRLQLLRDESIDEDNPKLIAQLRAIALGGQLEQAATIELAPVIEQAEALEESTDVEDTQPESTEAVEDEPVVEEIAPVAETSNHSDDLPPALAEAIQSGDEEKIIIAQTFYEEAEELLQEGRKLFDQWVTDRTNRSLLLGLQRVYHTIKGNARIIDQQMVGLMAYQLEVVFEQMSIHEFKSGRYDGLIKHTQQWLFDAIFHGKFEGADSLKAQLQVVDYKGSFIPEDNDSVVSSTIDFSAYQQSEFVEGDGAEPPAMYVQEEQAQEQQAQEVIRVSADLVEKLIDLSGENAINRSRIELDLGQMNHTLSEMELAIHRLADQLRRMEGELESQIMTKHEAEGQRYVDFDPLEMDQYSSLNQLSKSLAESASDLIDFKTTLTDKIRDTENLLLQQSRIQNELQQSLMGTRLVPFARLVPRLQRLVRQTSTTLDRPAELNIENTEGELDRNILEKLVSPLEHMLRNAIDHGIEDKEERAKSGKPEIGRINLNIAREGNDILVIFSDDGKGIDVNAVRAKAEKNGLITPEMKLSDVDVMQYIFNSGLSTAQKVTQISGRGVGLDVVQNEIKALGGHVSVTSVQGKGTEFTIRVPTTVAVSNALMVRVGDQQFAIPLAQIERIVRVSPVALSEYYDSNDEFFELDREQYRLRYAGEFITGQAKPVLTNMGSSVPVIIYNSGGRVVALQVDQLVGSRAQIVIKPIGKQLSSVGYVGGATILADGRVCLILDGQAVSRRVLTTPRTLQIRDTATPVVTPEVRVNRRTIFVVDDSVTVRKVTSRLLERQGFDVITAKDGVDAIEKLAQITPDLMLLDIEMPRMDGFEVAQYVRHDSQHKQLPIIMITSRTGEKHRERAFGLGVNEYMGKPFQEAELLANINALLETTQVG